jgi:hypothetical protein
MYRYIHTYTILYIYYDIQMYRYIHTYTILYIYYDINMLYMCVCVHIYYTCTHTRTYIQTYVCIIHTYIDHVALHTWRLICSISSLFEICESIYTYLWIINVCEYLDLRCHLFKTAETKVRVAN